MRTNVADHAGTRILTIAEAVLDLTVMGIGGMNINNLYFYDYEYKKDPYYIDV